MARDMAFWILCALLLLSKTTFQYEIDGDETTVAADEISTVPDYTDALNTSLPGDCHQQEVLQEFPHDLFDMRQRRRGALILHIVAAVYLFIAISIVCNVYFVTSLERTCEWLQLSEDVAGATVMAAGSSAPDLLISLVGIVLAPPDIRIGAIVGSSVFNILFIIGLCGAAAKQTLPLNWWPFIRDSVFYLVTLCSLLLSCVDGEITWYESVILLLMYIAYLVLMSYSHSIQSWTVRHVDKLTSAPLNMHLLNHRYITYDGETGEPNNQYASFPVDEYMSRITTKMPFQQACFRIMMTKRFAPKTRFKAAVYHVLLERRKLVEFTETPKGLSRTISECGTRDLRSEWIWPGHGSKVTWCLLLPVRSLVYFTIPDCETIRWRQWYLVTFFMSIVWMAILTYGLMWMVAIIGVTVGLSDLLVTLILLTASSNLPDTMSSVVVARQGLGDMAVSNTFGSNVFDLCVGLALPWTISTIIVRPGTTVQLDTGLFWYSVVVLVLSIFFTLLSMYVASWRLTRALGCVFLGSYLFYVTVTGLVQFQAYSRQCSMT